MHDGRIIGRCGAWSTVNGVRRTGDSVRSPKDVLWYSYAMKIGLNRRICRGMEQAPFSNFTTICDIRVPWFDDSVISITPFFLEGIIINIKVYRRNYFAVSPMPEWIHLKGDSLIGNLQRRML
jgi:hypothetical protein